MLGRGGGGGGLGCVGRLKTRSLVHVVQCQLHVNTGQPQHSSLLDVLFTPALALAGIQPGSAGGRVDHQIPLKAGQRRVLGEVLAPVDHLRTLAQDLDDKAWTAGVAGVIGHVLAGQHDIGVVIARASGLDSHAHITGVDLAPLPQRGTVQGGNQVGADQPVPAQCARLGIRGVLPVQGLNEAVHILTLERAVFLRAQVFCLADLLEGRAGHGMSLLPSRTCERAARDDGAALLSCDLLYRVCVCPVAGEST